MFNYSLLNWTIEEVWEFHSEQIPEINSSRH